MEKGRQPFVELMEAGRALTRIRDGRLYREGYGNFEAYCRERWHLGKSHAHRLIAAAGLATYLSPIGDTAPNHESQVRPLIGLANGQAAIAWQNAVKAARGGPVTAKHVKAAAAEFKPASRQAVTITTARNSTVDISVSVPDKANEPAQYFGEFNHSGQNSGILRCSTHRVPVVVIAGEGKQSEFLQYSLNSFPEFYCAASCGSISQALDEIRYKSPQIILMDNHLPGGNGTECIVRLRRLLPQVPVMIITSVKATDQLCNALLAGASGYLIQPVSVEELQAALREMMNGGARLCPRAQRLLLNGLHRFAEIEANPLTPRLRTVMAGLLAHRSAKEIATDSNLSVKAVQSARYRLYLKLHAHSAHEAIHHFLHGFASTREYRNHFPGTRR